MRASCFIAIRLAGLSIRLAGLRAHPATGEVAPRPRAGRLFAGLSNSFWIDQHTQNAVKHMTQ
jgi:hypothetical protein